MAAGRSRRFAAVAAGTGVVLVLAACGGESYTLNGEVVLRSPDDIAIGEQGGQPICAGAADSGYADIIGGEAVAVANAEGEVLKETTLGPGQPSADGTECTFPWQVTELPQADGYLVAVGNREPVPYGLEELRREEFDIRLVLED
jgi:hypothetical protein